MDNVVPNMLPNTLTAYVRINLITHLFSYDATLILKKLLLFFLYILILK